MRGSVGGGCTKGLNSAALTDKVERIRGDLGAFNSGVGVTVRAGSEYREIGFVARGRVLKARGGFELLLSITLMSSSCWAPFKLVGAESDTAPVPVVFFCPSRNL